MVIPHFPQATIVKSTTDPNRAAARCLYYTIFVPMRRISALYPVAFPTDISLRSISVVYATGYNADIRGIGHKYYMRGIKARGYP